MKRKLLIAGFDLKFLTSLRALLEHDARFEVKIDPWQADEGHDEQVSRQLLGWADLIFAEWCLGNALWYSEHKLPHQKLFIRFHRFEMERSYPKRLNLQNVDKMIFVGPYIQSLMEKMIGLPSEKSTLIYNAVDTRRFSTTKQPEAEFNIGLLQYHRLLKRPDRALDILEKLHQKDQRFTLHIKGEVPQYTFSWKIQGEREYFERFYRRLEASPCKESVVFDDFGHDVNKWFEKIGFLLSVSDIESFHLAVAEGMAASTIPMITGWKGADQLYPAEYIKQDVDEIVDAILFYSKHPDLYEQKRREVVAFTKTHFDLYTIYDQLVQLLIT